MRTAIVGLCTAVFAIGAFEVATAADLPVKARPAPAATIDPWTGGYVGVNIGGAEQRSCSKYTPQGYLDPVNDDFLSALDTGCSEKSGVVGGVQAGFNQRVNNWLWGLEADFNGLSTKTSRDASGINTTPNSFLSNQTTSVDMLATMRARFGMLMSPTSLLYVTGGLAMGNVKASGSELGTGTATSYVHGGSYTQWTPGWTVGAGGEWKISGAWSVKAEYLYVNLDPVRFDQSAQVVTNNGFENIANNIAMKTQLHIARVGLNYKLGGPSDRRDAYASAGPAVYNWSGFYAGMHLGGAWGHSRATDVEVVPGGGNYNAPGDTFSAKPSGGVGGGQAGYNWQMNSIVAGVEGDFGYLGFKGKQTSSLYGGETFVVSTGGAYGTFRGRLGATWDRTLIYATGGLIVADVGATVSTPIAFVLGDGIIFTGHTNVQTGWVAGGGVEQALMGGWSVKAEYMHFDLGTKTVSGSMANPGNPALNFTYGWDVKNTGDMASVGFNKKIF